MENIPKNIGNFAIYIGKILLPVVLSSLVFGGILAKYNNEMSLNKAILESAYQPMKQQYRECKRAQRRFRTQLAVYRAHVDSLNWSIEHGEPPPAEFWRKREYHAKNNATTLSELDDLEGNVMACYGAFTSLLQDVSLMLGEDGSELTKVIERRNKRLDYLIHRKTELFGKLNSHELDDLFTAIRQSSAKEIRRMAQILGNTVNIALTELRELDQMNVEAYKGQDGDFEQGDEIASKALRKRFKTGPFEFFN